MFSEQFRKFSHQVSTATGTPAAFGIAVSTVIVWALLGPMFQYSDTWQLVINTSTTIITFLMVFLIQNTQNRDSRAIHLKLDELIRAHSHARNQLIDLQELSDQELDQIHKELCELNEHTENRMQEIRQVQQNNSGRKKVDHRSK